MKKQFRVSILGAMLSLAAMLTIPVFSFAAELVTFPDGKFGVELTANGVKGVASVGPGDATISQPITLAWKAAGAMGCKGNWDNGSVLLGPSGTMLGTLLNTTVSRNFSVVCVGTGVAKSAKVTVRVVKPDLSVPKVVISGLTPKTITANGKTTPVKNTYLAGTELAVAYTLATTLRNGGKLKADNVVVSYRITSTPKNVASWANIVEERISTIAPGATQTVPAVVRSISAEPGKGWYFRACADPANLIVEVNEKNNCSPAIGPFIFE